MANTYVGCYPRENILSIIIETKKETLVLNYEKVTSIRFTEENGIYKVIAVYGNTEHAIEVSCKEELEAIKKRVIKIL